MDASGAAWGRHPALFRFASCTQRGGHFAPVCFLSPVSLQASGQLPVLMSVGCFSTKSLGRCFQKLQRVENRLRPEQNKCAESDASVAGGVKFISGVVRVHDALRVGNTDQASRRRAAASEDQVTALLAGQSEY